jgi:hypothetical protein
MKYVCIESGEVISVMDYQPGVPDTVTVVTITDSEADNLNAGTHIFNVSSSSVVAKSADAVAQENTETVNGTEREYLNTTDWKVLRHIRQQHLGIATSLTDAEYTQLETDREAAAQRIVDI